MNKDDITKESNILMDIFMGKLYLIGSAALSLRHPEKNIVCNDLDFAYLGHRHITTNNLKYLLERDFDVLERKPYPYNYYEIPYQTHLYKLKSKRSSYNIDLLLFNNISKETFISECLSSDISRIIYRVGFNGSLMLDNDVELYNRQLKFTNKYTSEYANKCIQRASLFNSTIK
jgi:hypothetical protein